MYRIRLRRSRVLILVAFILTVFVAVDTAWSVVAPFDSAKMAKEIEVMKSILSTRLSFADDVKEDERGDTTDRYWRLEAFEAGGRPRVEGFYLFDQGVVFTVGLHGVTHRRPVDLSSVEDRLERLQTAEVLDPRRLEMQLAMIENRLAESEALRAYAEALAQTEVEFAMGAYPDPEVDPEVAPFPEPPEPPEPGTPPAPPAPPEPPEPPEHPDTGASYTRARTRTQYSAEERERHMEYVKQRAVEMEERLKEAQQREREMEEQVEKYRARVTEELILALANHGDSLTELKADEYINLILVEGEGSFIQWASDPIGQPSGIFSVKKSDVTDYRTGRITLDEFKSRVLTYE
jgi:hypothetical protein